MGLPAMLALSTNRTTSTKTLDVEMPPVLPKEASVSATKPSSIISWPPVPSMQITLMAEPHAVGHLLQETVVWSAADNLQELSSGTIHLKNAVTPVLPTSRYLLIISTCNIL